MRFVSGFQHSRALLLATVMLIGVAPVGVAVAAEPAKVAPAKPPSITVIPAKRREVVETVAVTGSLLPREEVVVGVDIEGLKIMTLDADLGDVVKAGQILARLAVDTLQVQLAQNDSALAKAEAGIAQARSQIVQAQASQTEASAGLERAQTLKGKGFVSQEVLDQKLSASINADGRLATAQEGLKQAEADKTVVEAQRRELTLKLGKTDIKAPTDGLILARSARVGALASGAAEPLFRIARNGQIELDAEVPESALHAMKTGQRVAVTPAGFDEPVQGEIRQVSPQVDAATRLGHVRIALPVDSSLRPGSFARGKVEIGRREGVTVPLSAIQIDAGVASVQVVKAGKVETRTIKTGLRGDGVVEVVSGLADGENIVVRAGTFVRDGDLVTPVGAKGEEING